MLQNLTARSEDNQENCVLYLRLHVVCNTLPIVAIFILWPECCINTLLQHYVLCTLLDLCKQVSSSPEQIRCNGSHAMFRGVSLYSICILGSNSILTVPGVFTHI